MLSSSHKNAYNRVFLIKHSLISRYLLKILKRIKSNKYLLIIYFERF